MKKLLILVLLLLSFDVEAVNRFRSKSITAQNTYSDPITLGQSGGVLTLSGTWVANVKLQRKEAAGNWADVTYNTGDAVTFTSNGTFTINEPTGNADFRFGVPTGGFTSGTVVGIIEGK